MNLTRNYLELDLRPRFDIMLRLICIWKLVCKHLSSLLGWLEEVDKLVNGSWDRFDVERKSWWDFFLQLQDCLSSFDFNKSLISEN